MTNRQASRRRRICLVTTELAPFTKGGIGVLARNLLKEFCEGNDLLEVAVCLLDPSISVAAASHYFPGVQFHQVAGEPPPVCAKSYRYPAKESYRESLWLWNSYRVFRCLAELECRDGSFDFIEFPDWGGLAFCSAQARRSGQYFRNTQIVVRLHSTDSVLRVFEPRANGLGSALLSDIERKALRDADLVIGHIEAIANWNAEHYGFEGDWLKRVRIERPPVHVPRRALTPSMIHPETPIVFGSKLQRVKRPDVFVRGVSAFLRATPAYRGVAMVLAHAFDSDYASLVADLVPEDLAARFTFLPSLDNLARAQIIGGSVFVVPSDYESFCLAAYEASLLGGTVVLNGTNPAFGKGTPWVSGSNSRKYDGSALGLSLALAEVFAGPLQYEHPAPVAAVVDCVADPPYWSCALGIPERLPTSVWESSSSAAKEPRITAVVVNADQREGLLTTLEALSASDCQALEIIVVDDASTDPVSCDIINALQGRSGSFVRVIKNEVPLGIGASRNRAVSEARSAYVAFVDPGVASTPRFLSDAVSALDRAHEFAAYTTPVSNGTRGSSPRAATLVPIGEALSSGLAANFFCHGPFAVRREVLVRLPFNDKLDACVEWDYFFRLVSRGERCIVANHIGGEAIVGEAPSESLLAERDHMLSLWQHMPPSVGGGAVLDVAAFRVLEREAALASSNRQPLGSPDLSMPTAPGIARSGVYGADIAAEALLSHEEGQFMLRVLGAAQRRFPSLLRATHRAARPLKAGLKRLRGDA